MDTVQSPRVLKDASRYASGSLYPKPTVGLGLEGGAKYGSFCPLS